MAKSKKHAAPKNPHKWKCYEDGRIDLFVTDKGFHNGPGCTVCGFTFCHHCNPEGIDTECGASSIAPSNAKLDKVMVALDRSFRERLSR